MSLIVNNSSNSSPQSSLSLIPSSIPLLSLDVPSIIRMEEATLKKEELRKKIQEREILEHFAPTESGLNYLANLKKQMKALTAVIDNAVLRSSPAVDLWQELLKAIKNLKKEAVTAAAASEPEKRKPLLIENMKKIQEMLKEDFDFSQIAEYDHVCLVSFQRELRKTMDSLKAKYPTIFDDGFFQEYEVPLFKALLTFADAIDKIPKAPPSSVSIEKDMELNGGTCRGHTIAVHSNVPVGKESVRVAWFLQSSYDLSESFHSIDLQTAGRTILENPDQYPTVMSAAAQLFGFANIVEFLSAIMDPNSTFRKSVCLELLSAVIARIANKQRNEASEDFLKAFKIHKEKKQEIEELENTIKQENELMTQNPSEEGQQRLIKLNNLRDLLEESADYLYNDVSVNRELYLALNKIIPSLPDKAIPLHIMKRRKLKVETPIFSEKPRVEFQDCLRSASSNKEKFNLTFIPTFWGNYRSHTISIDFNKLEYCDINDTFIMTDYPKLRRFSTVEDMLESLFNEIEDNYNSEEFEKFTLTPIKDL